MTFANSAGLGVRNHYGPRKIVDTFGGVNSTRGGSKIIECSYDLSTLTVATSMVLTNPLGMDSNPSAMEAIIPAYSQILSAKLFVSTAILSVGGSAAAAGDTTAFSFGLDRADTGAAIDADGLIAAADANITVAATNVNEAKGIIYEGHGAALIRNFQYDGDTTGAAVDVTVVEGVGIGANAGQITALMLIDDVTGITSMTGVVKLVVEYVEMRNDASTRYTAGGVKA